MKRSFQAQKDESQIFSEIGCRPCAWHLFFSAQSHASLRMTRQLPNQLLCRLPLTASSKVEGVTSSEACEKTKTCHRQEIFSEFACAWQLFAARI